MDKNTIVVPFSAVSKQGRDDIYDLIDKILSDKDMEMTQPAEEE